MRNSILIPILALCLLISCALISSCDTFSTPVETGTDTDGVDAHIEWYHDADAYPTYGVDHQRMEHYYTHEITVADIEGYINELVSVGYAVDTAAEHSMYETIDEVFAALENPHEGTEVKFTMTRGDDLLILEFVYIGGDIWTSEIDS
ncbi:MAG: hypothetical protein LUJ25_00015 [Firmicutes bacterium]|nr:hypothetical protein [Bacillota bacterium]